MPLPAWRVICARQWRPFWGKVSVFQVVQRLMCQDQAALPVHWGLRCILHNCPARLPAPGLPQCLHISRWHHPQPPWSRCDPAPHPVHSSSQRLVGNELLWVLSESWAHMLAKTKLTSSLLNIMLLIKSQSTQRSPHFELLHQHAPTNNEPAIRSFVCRCRP